MKKLLLSLVLLGAVLSCKKDDDQPQRVVFKLTLASDIDLDGQQAYLIVRDHASTELIEYKTVAPGATISFETSRTITDGTLDIIYFVTETHNITDLGIIATQHYVNAYMGVESGSEWTWTVPDQPTPTITNTGRYSLTVNDVPSSYAVNFSDHFGLLANPNFNSGTVTSDLPVNSGANRQLVSIHEPGSSPKYKWIDNPVNGQDVTLNYSDLDEFDATLDLEFPEPRELDVLILGLDELPPPIGEYWYNLPAFVTLSDNSEISLSSLSVGFLDEFPLYATHISAHRDFNTFAYVSVGPRPTAFPFVDPDKFTITNRSFQDFAFNTTEDYLYRRVRFGYSKYVTGTSSESLNVNIHIGAKPILHYQFLPNDLVARFAVPMDKLSFQGAEFYLEGDSYSDFLKTGKNAYGNTLEPDPPFVQTYVSVN